ncbi:hypothetical protein [Flavobacterium sp.]|uniref:hypothetical protein n=1 Tax=Flavobacterium sp. TaxID=239 RepID=UPI00375014DD
MAKEKEKTAAELHFEANPEKEVLFGTSDGNLFEDKYFAKLHADTLDEGCRNVETFKNALHLEVKEEEEA